MRPANYIFSISRLNCECEMYKKCPDVLLLDRSLFAVKHQYLIELKYAKQ
ncbi:hypothetical protein SAMN05660964_01626 [Thiothrix caldifontis]|uniref:Uncharacterized protein n=1 Tax=Thiothrix caldifontis TaxID=525918 RepID=A0A1H4BDY4_9GAMM|nr:hypothetical protein SAMN05660964_01626 [Thiothrix caldifontis]